MSDTHDTPETPTTEQETAAEGQFPEEGGLLYPDLTIENFRAFRHLHIERFGRVNLITGKNNTGKSTLLEAMALLRPSPPEQDWRVLKWILQKRQTLFHGGYDIAIASLFFKGFDAKPNQEHQARIVSGDQALRLAAFPLHEALRMALTDSGEAETPLPMWRPSEILVDDEQPKDQIPYGAVGSLVSEVFGFHNFRGDSSGQAFVIETCHSIDPQLTRELWDRVVLAEVEDVVVSALQAVDPDVQSIRSIGDGPSRQTVIGTGRYRHRVPISSFGDGMNKVFNLILPLVNIRNGALLIDEFENGLHYTVQESAWRMIFKLARELNVQVFATTHSYDAVRAFQKVATEDPGDGVLVRLTRFDDGDIVPTIFEEERLQTIVEHDMEVR